MTELRKFTKQEVAETDGKSSHYFVIDNYVYDVIKFLDEHPGGHEVLVNVRGRDATEDFEDIGHSLDAKQLMKKYRVGELAEGEKRSSEASRRQVNWQTEPTVSADFASEDTSFFNSWKFPVALGLIVTVLYSYLFG